MGEQSRFRGCLLGLAIGDALGTTLEFRRPGTFEPLTDMVGGGPFNLPPGYWTDDTSMALCLAASLLECDGFDPVDQLRRYVRWWREGYLSSTGRCFDIGNTVRRALQRFEETGEAFPGPTDPWSASNGLIMRLAPVPMFYFRNPQLAIEMAACSSQTTHGSREAIDACRYLCALILGALQGVPKAELLAPHYCPIPNYWEQHPLAERIDEVAAGSFKGRQPPEIRGSGYVVHTLEAALWAFYRSKTFEEGCLMVVNLGEDADTTGAVYGQLAGAYYGAQGIPEHWLARLAHRPLIEDFADRLYWRTLNDGAQ